MKAHVLMSRKTGDLFEGQMVALVLDERPLDISPGYSIGVISPDARGWVVFHPEATGPFRLFFNAEAVEKLFEDLGEL
jgi:hypothetical protein